MVTTPQNHTSVWSTWAHQYQTQTTGIFQPHSVAELQEIIKNASAQGQRIKVAGRGRSSSAISQPDSALLRLDYINGLTRIDTEGLTATFRAGTTVREANQILGYYNLAFSNLGRLDEQTLAGAISTGFHGTGVDRKASCRERVSLLV